MSKGSRQRPLRVTKEEFDSNWNDIFGRGSKRVKFIGATDEQINWGGNDDPREALKEGDVYLVEKESVHSWHTKVKLKDIDGWFNSVSFEYQ